MEGRDLTPRAGGAPDAGGAPEGITAAEGAPPWRRPGWDDYFLEMAKLTATRATCPRRRVGAVLVRDHRVIATGYNGSVAGDDHCDDAGCLMVDGHCRRTIHAELNALLQCAINAISSAGSTMYCTDFPCVDCAKAMAQAQVRRVVYLSDYPDPNSSNILRRAGVELLKAQPGKQGYELETAPVVFGATWTKSGK